MRMSRGIPAVMDRGAAREGEAGTWKKVEKLTREERRLLRRNMAAAGCALVVTLLLAASADAWIEWLLLALEAAP